MIASLRGRLAALEPQRVVVDVGGVGYGVLVPLSTSFELERRGLGADVELQIHTHVREDALELFGFRTTDEKGLFEKLIAVSGIGPRLALGVLSGMEPAGLVAALAKGDVAALVRIPGVGKKTAERLVLELRDKALELAPADGDATPATGESAEELVAALLQLGYRPKEAKRAADALDEAQRDAPLSERLRLALRSLAKA